MKGHKAISFIDGKPAVRRHKVGSRITHDDELDYAPVGIGTHSYSVLPELEKKTGTLGFASVAVVDESGVIEAWVMRDVPEEEALDYVKENGKPKDWDPDGLKYWLGSA
jgi:hypothetical protein